MYKYKKYMYLGIYFMYLIYINFQSIRIQFNLLTYLNGKINLKYPIFRYFM